MNNFERWYQLPNFKGTGLYLDKLIDNCTTLDIYLESEDDNVNLKISFDYYYGYRRFNESERLEVLYTFHQSSDPADNHYIVYKTNKSEFINWLYDESCKIIDKKNVSHYLIFTSEDIIEVLAGKEPSVNNY